MAEEERFEIKKENDLVESCSSDVGCSQVSLSVGDVKLKSEDDCTDERIPDVQFIKMERLDEPIYGDISGLGDQNVSNVKPEEIGSGKAADRRTLKLNYNGVKCYSCFLCGKPFVELLNSKSNIISHTKSKREHAGKELCCTDCSQQVLLLLEKKHQQKKQDDAKYYPRSFSSRECQGCKCRTSLGLRAYIQRADIAPKLKFKNSLFW